MLFNKKKVVVKNRKNTKPATKYNIYKINFDGVAYVEAATYEEAKQFFNAGKILTENHRSAVVNVMTREEYSDSLSGKKDDKLTGLILAKYIINYALDCKRPISHLQLQKLMYYVNLSYLMSKGKCLIDEPFYVYPLGPTNREVYDMYKAYGPSKIFSHSKYEYKFSKQEESVIQYTLEKLLKMKSVELIDFSHREDSAWHKAMKENGMYSAIDIRLINEERANLLRNKEKAKTMNESEKEIGEPKWHYSVGIEEPEILGSGSVYKTLLFTGNKEKAIEFFNNNPQCNYFARWRTTKDLRRITEFYNKEKGVFQDDA